MQVANAIMILVMIPLFNTVIYPLCAKCNLLTTSLQRIGLGFFMAALAFGVSGVLDLQLEVLLFKPNNCFLVSLINLFRKPTQNYQKKALVNCSFMQCILILPTALFILK